MYFHTSWIKLHVFQLDVFILHYVFSYETGFIIILIDISALNAFPSAFTLHLSFIMLQGKEIYVLLPSLVSSIFWLLLFLSQNHEIVKGGTDFWRSGPYYFSLQG